MYMGSFKRKKINLWVILLILLFVISVAFTFIHIFNNSKANTDSNRSKNTVTIGSTINSFSGDSVDGDLSIKNITSNNDKANNEFDGSAIGKIYSYTEFYDIETNEDEETTVSDGNTITNENSLNTLPTNEIAEPEPTTSSSEKILVLNNHKYVFGSDKNVHLQNPNSSGAFIQLNNLNYSLKINTDSCKYSDLKTKSNLKQFLQVHYDISITSNIKTGNVKDNDLIICTISENGNTAYFIITPLNDSEILYIKVFNLDDMSVLLSDLSGPIDEILYIKKIIE